MRFANCGCDVEDLVEQAISPHNYYTYVGNDPLDKTDPSGLYSCGTVSSTECAAFVKAQTEAIKQIKGAQNALGALRSSLAAGKGTGGFFSATRNMARRIEANLGKGSATLGNVDKVMARNQGILGGLESTTQKANSAAQPAGQPDARAASPVGGHGDIVIYPAFTRNDIGVQTQARALGHEADHGENGVRDQKLISGQKAYGAEAARQLATENPAAAAENPDNQSYIDYGDGVP